MPPPRKPHQSLPAQSLSLSSPLSSLFSALSILPFCFSSFVLLSRCIVQNFPFFSALLLQLFISFSSLSLHSSRLVSSFLPIYECRCISRQSRRHIPDRFLLPLLCSLISHLFSSYLLLSSHFSLLSPLFASPLLPCLSFPLLLSFFFCLSPFSRLSRSLLSLYSCRLLLFLLLLPVRPQASDDTFLTANFEVGALATCSDMPSAPKRQSPQIPPQLFPGVAGGECASPAVKNLDVTLVPQAARLQRTVEAALCELPAPSAHRSFVLPCYVPLFCSVFLLVLRSLMMMTLASNLVHYAPWPFARNHDAAENGTHWPRNSKNADLPQS